MRLSFGLAPSDWACLLFHRRMTGHTSLPEELYQQSIAKLTNILYVQSERETDRRRQARIVWPMFIAAIETNDSIHRHWLVDKLKEIRTVTAECALLFSTAQEILTLEGERSRLRVDLAKYMRPQA